MAGVIDQKGQREASIRYLEEELKKDLSPEVKDITEERLRLLRHEVRAETLQVQKRRSKRRRGNPSGLLIDWQWMSLTHGEKVG